MSLRRWATGLHFGQLVVFVLFAIPLSLLAGFVAIVASSQASNASAELRAGRFRENPMYVEMGGSLYRMSRPMQPRHIERIRGYADSLYRRGVRSDEIADLLMAEPIQSQNDLARKTIAEKLLENLVYLRQNRASEQRIRAEIDYAMSAAARSLPVTDPPLAHDAYVGSLSDVEGQRAKRYWAWPTIVLCAGLLAFSFWTPWAWLGARAKNPASK